MGRRRVDEFESLVHEARVDEALGWRWWNSIAARGRGRRRRGRFRQGLARIEEEQRRESRRAVDVECDGATSSRRRRGSLRSRRQQQQEEFLERRQVWTRRNRSGSRSRQQQAGEEEQHEDGRDGVHGGRRTSACRR